MSILIKKAQAEDIPAIFFFIKELARYEKLEHEVAASQEDLKETLFGEKAYAEVLLAQWEGENVGFALFFHNYSTFLGKPGIHLEDLYVLNEYRGRGMGKALLAHLAQLAVERNCGRLEWAVLDWNQPAIDFYESIQAKPLSDWITYRLTENSLDQLASECR